MSGHITNIFSDNSTWWLFEDNTDLWSRANWRGGIEGGWSKLELQKGTGPVMSWRGEKWEKWGDGCFEVGRGLEHVPSLRGEEGAEDSTWKVCEREEQLLKSEFFGHRGHRDETKGGELSSSIIDERPRCSEEDEAASCSVISEARSRWDKSCLFSSSAHRRSNSIWVKVFDNEYHQFVCLFSVSCLSCLPCLPSNSCLSWCLSLCFLALLSLWSLLPISSPTQSG